MGRTFEFQGSLWEYPGEAPWVFVTLPAEVADGIADLAAPGRGFGSVRVDARLGATTWSTSLFPDRRSASYLLPVKRAVREAEGLVAGDVVGVRLEVDDPP
ncbi:MAG: DUF1905 domain-containing protein [Acidimicrobiia bacterium]